MSLLFLQGHRGTLGKQSLHGADRLFHQLGYQLSTRTTRKGYRSTYFVQAVAIDKEIAMSVARDCLLASVECKILVSAMQELSTIGTSATWEELIAFRRGQVGTPQQIAMQLVLQRSFAGITTGRIETALSAADQRGDKILLGEARWLRRNNDCRNPRVSVQYRPCLVHQVGK